jgi:muconolactone delta-isomerase
MIMDAASEFDVLEIIATMPLSDYLDPYISELMFHDSSEVVHEFSLN